MHFCLHLKRKVYFLHTHPFGKYLQHNCRGNERQSLYSSALLKINAHKFKCLTINLFVLNIKKLRKSFLFVIMKASFYLHECMYYFIHIYIYISDGDFTTVALLNVCLLKDNFGKRF